MPEADSNEIEDLDDNVRYDLAGNPIPGLPSAARSSLPTSPAPTWSQPGKTIPPAFTPPPGALPLGFTPPPGSAPSWGGPAAAAPKSPGGLLLYAGLGAGALVIIALIFALRAAKPVMVAAPTSYKTYTALDNTFSCDQPAGWDVKESGAQGGSLSSVTFLKGNARFKVISDAAGSLMSESTISANANLPPEQQTPPVQKLHDTDKAELVDGLPGYKEGAATTFASAVGDSRASEWTADGETSGSKLHGYRITMLDKERKITVICSSPERNWAILKPAFQHLIDSLVPGNG